jgi:hypothetical protein
MGHPGPLLFFGVLIDLIAFCSQLALVDELSGAGIKIRGHNLVWPTCSGSGKVPSAVCAAAIAANTSQSRATLEAAIEAHIVDEVSTLKEHGCCEEFDVVNEPYGNPEIVRFLGVGNTSLLRWLAATKGANPAAGRRLNEDRVCSAFFDIDSPQQVRAPPIPRSFECGPVGSSRHVPHVAALCLVEATHCTGGSRWRRGGRGAAPHADAALARRRGTTGSSCRGSRGRPRGC